MKQLGLFLLTASLIFASACTHSERGKAPISKEQSAVPTPEQTDIVQAADSTLTDSLREQLIERLASRKQFDQALEQIDRLLQKNPSNPAWLYMKADALEKKSDTVAAIALYQQALTAAGIFVEAEMRLANLYAETGNKKALEVCSSLLQQPGALRFRSDILLLKGIYYTRVKDVTNAFSVFNQIIKEDYSYLDAYIEKGLLYYDRNQPEEALKVFQLSTTLKNSFADGYYWMAKCEEKLNRTQEAINNYKRALALDQSFEEAREGLKRLGEIK